MTRRYPPGPKPTIGDLQRTNVWMWLYCPACDHRRAVTLARYAILLGTEESSDTLRARSRCSACEHLGALTYAPSWMGTSIGFAPFPGEERG